MRVITAFVLLAFLAWPIAAMAELGEHQAKQKIREHLQGVLKHGDSYEDISWSKLIKHPQGGAYSYSIRHKYRFTHSYNEKGNATHGVCDQVFHLDYEGNIVGGETLKPNTHHPQKTRWRP